jgi:hypothetical protein
MAVTESVTDPLTSFAKCKSVPPVSSITDFIHTPERDMSSPLAAVTRDLIPLMPAKESSTVTTRACQPTHWNTRTPHFHLPGTLHEFPLVGP